MLKQHLSFFLSLLSFSLNAQQQVGGLVVQTEETAKEKTIKKVRGISSRKMQLINDPLTPSRAAFYSAVLPGLGQAYLGKAWKIPIIYAAIGTSVYFYVRNDKEINRYRTAYKRRLAGYTDDEFAELISKDENFKLLEGMKFHKRYRDISLLFTLGLYILNILEANVAAHLLQFDVGDDLSLSPNVLMDDRQVGLSLAIKFNKK